MSKFNFFKKILNNNFAGEIIEKNKVYKIKNEIKKLNFLKTKKRKLVLIYCYNEKQSIVSYFFSLANNDIPILINSELDEEFVENLIKKYNPEIIITKKKLKFNSFVIQKKINNYFFYKNKIKVNFKFFKDLALLLPTSGSTGSPKFVRISYKNLYYNTKDIVRFLNIKSNHTTITTLPYSYTYGMSILNSHLYVAGKIVSYNGTVIEKEFFDLIRKWKVNNFGGVPTIFEILKRLNLDNFDLKSITYITQAGGSLSKDLIKYYHNYLKKNKIKFITMYGSTEATSRMSYLPPELNLKKTGSIGKGLQKSFRLLEITKKNKAIKKNYKIGELEYKGKNVSLGYSISLMDLNKKDNNKGILRTGDVGFRDKDGFYYITGRLDRYVKIYGQRINIDEVEEILRSKFEGTCIKFFKNVINIYSEIEHEKLELINFISSKIKIHKSIIKYIKIKKIPLNSNGKINYAKLR